MFCRDCACAQAHLSKFDTECTNQMSWLKFVYVFEQVATLPMSKCMILAEKLFLFVDFILYFF